MSKTNLLILYLIFGAVIGILGCVLCYVWYGWKLTLVIFLIIWSNNIGQRLSNK